MLRGSLFVCCWAKLSLCVSRFSMQDARCKRVELQFHQCATASQTAGPIVAKERAQGVGLPRLTADARRGFSEVPALWSWKRLDLRGLAGQQAGQKPDNNNKSEL